MLKDFLYIYLILKYFQKHLEDVKNRLGKSLVDAGGSLLEDELSGSDSPSACSKLIFVPAIAMYGLLIIFTIVGKYKGSENMQLFLQEIVPPQWGEPLSLATVGSHV